ncbi:hypothetical protein MKZ38_010710 [Zalerion maritima]|uniref:Uncharacterized protein n=1 Tax=Zalerion maritima TaxID=339359 RepID=A0AAD5RTS2_9PEZI|nr:hypothetical protein MKZ38_010710 [Zalerion maritima]
MSSVMSPKPKQQELTKNGDENGNKDDIDMADTPTQNTSSSHTPEPPSVTNHQNPTSQLSDHDPKPEQADEPRATESVSTTKVPMHITDRRGRILKPDSLCYLALYRVPCPDPKGCNLDHVMVPRDESPPPGLDEEGEEEEEDDDDDDDDGEMEARQSRIVQGYHKLKRALSMKKKQ